MSYSGIGSERGYAGLGDADVGEQIAAQVGPTVSSDLTKGASAGTVTKDVAKSTAVVAASVGAGIALGAACSLVPGGVAVAPLCAIAGGKLTQFVISKIGPIIDDIGDVISGIFSSSKAEEARRHAAENLAFLAANAQTISLRTQADTLLKEAVTTLHNQHEKLGLVGDYGYDAATQDLKRLGLPLQTYPWPWMSARPGTKDIWGIPVGARWLAVPMTPADQILFDPSFPKLADLSTPQLTQLNQTSAALFAGWIPRVQGATAAVLSEFIARRAAQSVAQEVLAQVQRAKEQHDIDARNMVAYAQAVQAKQARRKKLLVVGALATGGYLLWRHVK
jgi:hypothetical protein